MNELLLILSVVLIFLVVCVLLEAWIITAFKITTFGRALLQAFLVNGASVAVIYFSAPLLSRMDIDEGKLFPLMPLLWSTIVIVEAICLMLLNRTQPLLRVILASAAMNTASVAVLYCILSLL